MENYYQTSCCYSPSWMKEFKCLAENCPQTCCQGWNIPVDEKHASFYQNLADKNLHEITDSALRKISTGKGKNRSTEYFLNLLKQPDEICPFLSEAKFCRLQEKYGEFALCDTCFFFPRYYWQIDSSLFLSASLSCPKVRELALLNPNRMDFESIETYIDPHADWLFCEFIRDDKSRILLKLRDDIVKALIKCVQNRGRKMPDRLANACNLLISIGEMIENGMDEEAIRNILIGPSSGELSDPFFTSGECEDPVRLSEWIKVLNECLNWGLEGASKSSIAIQRNMISLLAGETDPIILMAEHYRMGRDNMMELFSKKYAHLPENFMVLFFFSDCLKQFSQYQQESITVDRIVKFEIAQVVIVWSLLKIQAVNKALQIGSLTVDSFLQIAAETDRDFLHYPAYIRQCAQRLSMKFDSNEKLIQCLFY